MEELLLRLMRVRRRRKKCCHIFKPGANILFFSRERPGNALVFLGFLYQTCQTSKYVVLYIKINNLSLIFNDKLCFLTKN